MHDLKKVEENFREFLKSRLDERRFRIDEIEITEKLLSEQEAFSIPFASVSYFLVNEDEKPVLYVNIASRMGSQSMVFIDENGYEEYDVYDGGKKEIRKRFESHAEKVRKFEEERDLRRVDMD
jgi:hypothetical protein